MTSSPRVKRIFGLATRDEPGGSQRRAEAGKIPAVEDRDVAHREIFYFFLFLINYFFIVP
jgi:hypothetical protein